ncbi:DEAD/DEAH box helicase [Paenibacillus sp. J2TS4]|uniref:DEAD/DEAH box helicase n=1 Tax=Paenibacillus sp. J2TS4 TaxID=2807194 RepID=UPI001B1DF115|nr:helicase-related protein [Paenibacillus sp. J2TS4]GIP35591.1 hypothetical protein J2TS4_48010 [Paenibacillus sp. J2TS4]
MKVTLYGAQIQGEWKWKFSLDFQVDVSYWLGGQERRVDRLVRILPELSVGQAVWLIENMAQSPLAVQPLASAKEELKRRIHKLPIGITTDSIQLELIESGNYDEIITRETIQEAEEVAKLIQGRSLLHEELQPMLGFHNLLMGKREIHRSIQLAYLQGWLEYGNGMDLVYRRQGWKRALGYRCRRCGTGESRMFWSECLHCGQACPYCEECLTMGRVRFCSLLVQGTRRMEDRPEIRSMDETAPLGGELRKHLQERWKLSPAQTEASLAGLEFLASHSSFGRQARNHELDQFLIWAVTGAGKTEMIFPLIEHELQRGRNVLVATPRKDVVLELMPRLKAAFPAYSIVTLYGGSPQKWEQGDITLATTHQLLRFHGYFDMAIIDELDAFPFHNNPMLQFAARKVLAEHGRTVFLSATPPLPMQKAAARKKLPHVKVPVRYHRHPLPVPVIIRTKRIQDYIKKQKLPSGLLNELQASLQREAQIFVFISRIKWVEPMVELLRQHFPDTVIEGTSSMDPLRTEKVILFRENKIGLLVTTTILERGVTVPRTDVFILNADAELFDEASLVQMAGRAGRSKDDPNGRVFFVAEDKTRSQAGAINQMKLMNRLARNKGYLVNSKEE